MKTVLLTLVCATACLAACTIPHSKQALLDGGASRPMAESRFVTEEDSGVSLFGVISFSEPDHYAVLIERARRNHRCSRMHHAQLDYYTDHWILLAFPISRVTFICDPEAPAPKPARSTATPTGNPAPAPSPPGAGTVSTTHASPPEAPSVPVAEPSASASGEPLAP